MKENFNSFREDVVIETAKSAVLKNISLTNKKNALNAMADQGCINCGILVSGIRARGVTSEHMENMEMFSCSPT